jgi:hypothetical protein
VQALIFSQIMAVIWWIVAQIMRDQGAIVWYDQQHIFRRSVGFLLDPYSVGGFVHTPWIIPLLAPFSLFPLALSVLIQSGLYFALITAIIFKFKGDRWAVILTLTSFIALNAVLELNVDWFVLIGLVIPVAWSGPFLLLKPQLALGYYLGVPPREWLKIGMVTAVVVAISILIWGFWFFEIAQRVPTLSIAQTFNIAPSKHFTPLISWPIGALIAWQAFRRQDPPLGVIAWFFFTPYIAPYSLVLLMAILAIRFRVVGVAVWIATWGVLFAYLT